MFYSMYVTQATTSGKQTRVAGDQTDQVRVAAVKWEKFKIHDCQTKSWLPTPKETKVTRNTHDSRPHTNRERYSRFDS